MSRAESIGASGFDRFDNGRRTVWLTELHDAALHDVFFGLLIGPIGLGTLIVSAGRRVLARATRT